MIPIWSLHRDTENFSNANEFKPERFSENGSTKSYKEKGQFIPFGDGPRQCLGMRFATAQSKAAIIGIVKNFDMSLSSKTRNPYVLDPKSFVSKPTGGIWITLKKFT